MRSKAEQNGIDASRTNCKYPSSYHNWGLAFDFCRYEDVDNDGQVSDDAYNVKGNFFFKVGQVGKSLGLDWGGDFKSIYDGPHFEYKGFGTRSQIEAKYSTPEQYFASWIYKPLKTITVKSSKEDIKWLQAKINRVVDGNWFPLKVDGDYGNKTRITVLIYWDTLGWNKKGTDDGWRVGKKTMKKLDKI